MCVNTCVTCKHMQHTYMIRLLTIIILFTCTTLYGQSKVKTKPFILKGQITDCPEKYLILFLSDNYGLSLQDTLHLDEKGNFYLETFKVKEPQRVGIKRNKIGISNLFVAPGYNLTITGNGKDGISLNESIKISGLGSESNRYYFMLDSVIRARKDITNWLDLNETDLLLYIKTSQKLKDSIAHVVFDKSPFRDKYFNYFGAMVHMDNVFNKLYMLITHVFWNNYNYEKSISFIRTNFDNKILDNLYKDEYLISYNYRNWIVGGQWIDYLVELDYKKDSSLQNQKDYPLKKISETYRGKVKQFALFHRLNRSMEKINSFDELNEAILQYETYGTHIKNLHYKKTLDTRISQAKNVLFKTQNGKPAPSFTLPSNLGTTYSLEDFKGKVVYLDLWASWCVSCREETPSMKALYVKYKNDKRIAIVGIGVHDGVNNWKKAIKEDRPEWIQLLDKEGVVVNSYAAIEIPRFILIDKKGNIVTSNAPKPSSGKEIENLLNQEIEK